MRPPSAGCLLLLVATALTTGFLLWGAQEPELERVWWRLHELKIGRVNRLAPDDLELLRRTIADYPKLASQLLDDQPVGILSGHTEGWLETEYAYLLVQPGLEEGPRLTISCQLPAHSYPATVILSGSTGSLEIEFQTSEPVSVALPREVREGAVIELRLQGVGLGSAAAGVQVRFPEKT